MKKLLKEHKEMIDFDIEKSYPHNITHRYLIQEIIEMNDLFVREYGHDMPSAGVEYYVKKWRQKWKEIEEVGVYES